MTTKREIQDAQQRVSQMPDVHDRMVEANASAVAIISIDGRIEDAQQTVKALKASRDELIARLVAVTGAERQQTLGLED